MGDQASAVQVAMRVESREGTKALTSAKYLIPVLLTPSNTATVNEVERNLAKGTLTKSAPVAGDRPGASSGEMELVGNAAASNTTPPPFDPVLQGAGLRRRAVKILPITATWTTGSTAPHEQVLISAISGALGTGSQSTWRVIGVPKEGDAYVFLENVSGSGGASDDALVDAASGTAIQIDYATGALQSPADAFAYHPADDTLVSIDVTSATAGTLEVGDTIYGDTGGRGRVVTAISGTSGTVEVEVFRGNETFSGTQVHNTGGDWDADLTAGTQVMTQVPSVTVTQRWAGEERDVTGERFNASIVLTNKQTGRVRYEGQGAGNKPVEQDLWGETREYNIAASWTTGASVAAGTEMYFDDGSQTGSGSKCRVVEPAVVNDATILVEMISGEPAAGDTVLVNDLTASPAREIPFTTNGADTANYTKYEGFPADTARAPLVSGSFFQLRTADGTTTHLPCFREMTIDLGNTLALRECPNNASASGFDSAVISDRAPTLTIDPEAVRESVVPIMGDAWDKNAYKVVARMGTTGTGNAFEIHAPAAYPGNVGDGERDNIRTRSIPMVLTGTVQDELFIYVH